jgi:hypothetical protein
MWFLGIIWACIVFLCGIGWDIFIWLWQEIPLLMCFMSFGLIYGVFLVGSFISMIFDFIGSIFGD